MKSATDLPPCPFGCEVRGSVEHVGGDRYFCNGCGREFRKAAQLILVEEAAR
jgi:hypothetical protein